MERSRHTDFVEACEAAFGPLVDDHGFSPPETQVVGREVYVRYRKGGHVVSVAHEAGSLPIVELFYPSAETGEPATPWAEEDGVARSRRIPRLARTEQERTGERRLQRQERKSGLDFVTMRDYLESQRRSLEAVESQFLSNATRTA